jgi:hypothetical protein
MLRQGSNRQRNGSARCSDMCIVLQQNFPDFLNSSPNGKETWYIDDQLFMYRIVLAILEASLVASFSCRRLLFSFV